MLVLIALDGGDVTSMVKPSIYGGYVRLDAADGCLYRHQRAVGRFDVVPMLVMLVLMTPMSVCGGDVTLDAIYGGDNSTWIAPMSVCMVATFSSMLSRRLCRIDLDDADVGLYATSPSMVVRELCPVSWMDVCIGSVPLMIRCEHRC